jgi:hypothetical protein
VAAHGKKQKEGELILKNSLISKLYYNFAGIFDVLGLS